MKNAVKKTTRISEATKVGELKHEWNCGFSWHERYTDVYQFADMAGLYTESGQRIDLIPENYGHVFVWINEDLLLHDNYELSYATIEK